jgi:hypothetical protein
LNGSSVSRSLQGNAIISDMGEVLHLPEGGSSRLPRKPHSYKNVININNVLLLLLLPTLLAT